jgi:hypothetical protein
LPLQNSGNNLALERNQESLTITLTLKTGEYTVKTWKVIGITALMVVGASWSGVVQAAYIDQRGLQQQQLIQEGIQSGALTPREAARLQAEQQQIQAARAQMSANGRLTPNEKVILDQMQENAARDIYRLTHNNQANFRRGDNHHQPPWTAEQPRHWREQERRHYWGRY